MEKELYSITELVALGYSRYQLKCDVHARRQNFAFTSPNGGKWYVHKARYDEYLQKRRS